MKTQMEIYYIIYKTQVGLNQISQMNKNDASRAAHIIAVQKTWRLYNEQFKPIGG